MTIEAMTILRELQIGMHLGPSHLIIESDYQNVVKSILQRVDSTSEIGNLIYEIKEWMRKFQDCSIQFIHRQCSRVAHTFARFAWSVYNICLWYGVISNYCQYCMGG